MTAGVKLVRSPPRGSGLKSAQKLGNSGLNIVELPVLVKHSRDEVHTSEVGVGC